MSASAVSGLQSRHTRARSTRGWNDGYTNSMSSHDISVLCHHAATPPSFEVARTRVLELQRDMRFNTPGWLDYCSVVCHESSDDGKWTGFRYAAHSVTTSKNSK